RAWRGTYHTAPGACPPGLATRAPDAAWTLRLLGDIAMHRDPSACEEAATAYRQALSLAQDLGMRPLQAHCHRGLGMLFATMDQWEQARAELSVAIGLYRAMEMSFWLPETDAALVQVNAR